MQLKKASICMEIFYYKLKYMIVKTAIEIIYRNQGVVAVSKLGAVPVATRWH